MIKVLKKSDLINNSHNLRSPDKIMTAESLGATKAYRLSFARSMVRKMTCENWRINLTDLDVDSNGIGRALYQIKAKSTSLGFLIFSDQVPEIERTGRLSESRFDGMGVIFDGPFSMEMADLEYTEMLKRSKGQTTIDGIAWTLCTRSSRFFSKTVEALADGRQPFFSAEDLSAAYLLRNNGCYGNGRHGTRMWESLGDDHPLSSTYFPEMFALYMWREFGFVLVEEMARQINPKAVRLPSEFKRYLGIGNSTGQGMSTFVVKWPRWINTWCVIREKAISLAINQDITIDNIVNAKFLIERVLGNLEHQKHELSPCFLSSVQLAKDLKKIYNEINILRGEKTNWGSLIHWCISNVHQEAVEQFYSILTEVHGSIVDPLQQKFSLEMNKSINIDLQMTIGELRNLINTYYGWAFNDILCGPNMTHYFFYRSEEHGEQRRGERYIDAGSINETFTAVPTAVRQLNEKLSQESDTQFVAIFLAKYPEYRFITERIRTFWNEPYAEIRTSIPGYEFQPAHIIRFVLATFGMETAHFSTEKWVQGTFFQGAPLSSELDLELEIGWFYPGAPIYD